MIPLRDENPTRTTPYVVYGLIALNVAAFLYNGTLGLHAGNPLAGFELIPAELTTGRDIGMPTPVPPWVTIFTSMFLHANWLHVFGNMLYLWIFGNNIEDVLGHFRFLIFYFAAGAGAAFAEVFINPTARVPMVGASGAIAGLLGAYLILFPRARIITLFFVQVIALPASIVLTYWIAIQVFNSLLLGSGMVPGGGVAYAAHIGGFGIGMAMILMFGGRRLLRGRRPVEYRRRYYWS